METRIGEVVAPHLELVLPVGWCSQIELGVGASIRLVPTDLKVGVGASSGMVTTNIVKEDIHMSIYCRGFSH